jgi:hypothetical protein
MAVSVIHVPALPLDEISESLSHNHLSGVMLVDDGLIQNSGYYDGGQINFSMALQNDFEEQKQRLAVHDRRSCDLKHLSILRRILSGGEYLTPCIVR